MSELEETATEHRRRGVGFPQLPLKDSVNAIVAIGQNGPMHSHDAAAAYLGHRTANSGAFRTKLAALRDWGLIERGGRDSIVLTALAQELVLEAPTHEDARQLLLTAFESCRVFGVLYHDSAKNTPLEVQRLRTSAVMRQGVSSEQAGKFVDSFVESVTYVGLGSFDGSKLTLLAPGRDWDDGDSPKVLPRAAAVSAESSPITPSEHLRASLGTPRESRASDVYAVNQSWAITNGAVEFAIRTPNPLPASVYTLLAEMVGLAERIQAALNPPPEPAGGAEQLASPLTPSPTP